MHIVSDPDLHQAQRAWLDGGSALPLVILHAERGEILEAATVARAALEQDPCPDYEAIERLLYTFDEAPAEWNELLYGFAQEPSLGRWKELLKFVPDDLLYQRIRNSIRRLRALGVDGNILFLCACELGMTPDAIGLVEDGLVAASTIVERASTSGGAKTTYLGLAATAAFLAGDLVATIRLLRESAAHENELCTPFPHIYFIREHATPEVAEMLDRSGIPAP
jgi:hypothetical protein